MDDPHSSEFPYPWEDIDEFWALDAIDQGNGSVLARYLREFAQIDQRVRRAIAKMLGPDETEKHTWKLRPTYRKQGKPTKRAMDCMSQFIAIDQKSIAQRLSTSLNFAAKTRQDLANMLDPDSHHPLFLEFKRNRP